MMLQALTSLASGGVALYVAYTKPRWTYTYLKIGGFFALGLGLLALATQSGAPMPTLSGLGRTPQQRFLVPVIAPFTLPWTEA